MKKFILVQRIAPQRTITNICGKLAASQNWLIKRIIIFLFNRYYLVNLKDALIEKPYKYSSFNDLFARALKPEARPIAKQTQAIIAPADGRISAIGKIHNSSMLQAKNHFYSVQELLGQNAQESVYFEGGSFATIYLAPHNYHRVHMPIAGQITHSCFIPGDLFSVNNTAVNHIPNLFTRNERLICHFKNKNTRFAMVMVGAMIVGSIQPIWKNQPIRSKRILHNNFIHGELNFSQGDELGRFLLGSTIIMIFPRDYLRWQLGNGTITKMGQMMGTKISGARN